MPCMVLRIEPARAFNSASDSRTFISSARLAICSGVGPAGAAACCCCCGGGAAACCWTCGGGDCTGVDVVGDPCGAAAVCDGGVRTGCEATLFFAPGWLTGATACSCFSGIDDGEVVVTGDDAGAGAGIDAAGTEPGASAATFFFGPNWITPTTAATAQKAPAA